VAQIESARFLNVGQGDAALVSLDNGWRAILDGGRDGDLEQFLPYLLGMEHVALILGTHFDADHLEGLALLVEEGLAVEQAIVPPQVHPTGEPVAVPGARGSPIAESRLLADHFAAGRSMEDVYAPLDRRAKAVLRSVQPLDEEIRRLERREGDASRSARPTSERRAPHGEASHIAEAANLGSIARLLDVAARGANRRELHMPSMRRFERAASVLSRELISARSLKRLIEALEEARIPWAAPAAPDDAGTLEGASAGLPAGVKLWHLAPTRRYISHFASHVADVWDRVMRALALEVDTSLPTLSNRLSHVLVIEDEAGASLAICGDSGFQFGRGVPDSVADGWEVPFGRIGLLHLPHHGGYWGRFGSRANAVLASRQGALTIYGSMGANKANPPGKAVEPFVTSVTADRGGRLFLANVPSGPLGTFVRRRFRKRIGRAGAGPAILEFEPAGSSWKPRSRTKSGAPSSVRPVGIRLP
jgi:hypothetical protein